MTIFDFDNFPIPGRTTRTNKDTTRQTSNYSFTSVVEEYYLESAFTQGSDAEGAHEMLRVELVPHGRDNSENTTFVCGGGGGLVFMGRGESGHVIEIRTPQELNSIEFVIIEFRALKLGGTHGPWHLYRSYLPEMGLLQAAQRDPLCWW